MQIVFFAKVFVLLLCRFLCMNYLELLSQLNKDHIGHNQEDMRPE